MTDTAAPRYTALQMMRTADVLSGTPAAMMRQAAADLASAPTREELARIIHAKSTGYPAGWDMTTDSYKEQWFDIVDALIAAGVKVRHE